MPSNPEVVYQLKCSCNSYPWGKQGSDSLSARLCQNQPGWAGESSKTDFTIDESKPYAEMWFGTYPVLPSYVADTGEDLQDVIDRNPKELIGEQVMNKFGHSKIPFLPKVLSISKALPLQLHPNKELASKLHQEKPDDFTDPNHKPEIAIALSEFEAFCGFKPLQSIARLLEIDAVKRFLPPGIDSFTEGHKQGLTDKELRTLVKNMLEADDATIRETYQALINESPERYSEEDHYIPKLAPRLAKQYSRADPGVLVALVTMNYLVLQPGESIYIPADGIHAYLSGDIIECMARSNNVLNTGFCPSSERSNVELFCSCLTFTPHDIDECMLRPRSYDGSRAGKTKIFSPPMSEFDMLETQLAGGGNETLEAVAGPSMVLTTKGSGQMSVKGKSHALKEGSVYFVAHGVELQFEAGGEGLQIYTACVK